MSETDQFSQHAKEKHIYGTKLTEQSNYWNDRAEECRTLAELLRAPRAKARMLQVADTYERLASRQRDKEAGKNDNCTTTSQSEFCSSWRCGACGMAASPG